MRRGLQHRERRPPGDDAAEDNRALRGVGMWPQEGWIMSVKGSLKGGRVGIEREGQGRGSVDASMILGLREGLHGERRWTHVGLRREVLEQEEESSSFGLWKSGRILGVGRGLGIGPGTGCGGSSIP